MSRLSRRAVLHHAGLLGASTAGLAVLGACGLLPMQAPRRMPRIAFLTYAPRDEARFALVIYPFVDGLRNLGYIEGQTITIEWRFTLTNEAQDREALDEVIRLPVDVIVVNGTPASFVARQATSTIPIVALTVANPVETGLVASLARPGAGNFTALASTMPGVYAKQLDLLRDVVPGLARVAALVNVTSSAYESAWEELKSAAAHAGLQVQRIDLHSADEIEEAFSGAALSRPEALADLQNPLLLVRRDRFAALALQHRLPATTQVREYVASGALMSYGANLPAIARRGAAYVDKILRGARPADLPVEQPTVFDLTVNVNTLKALGLTIPSSVAPLVTEWVQ